MLTGMSFHSITISTIYKDYNSLSMLQSSPLTLILLTKYLSLSGLWSYHAYSDIVRKNGSPRIFTSSGILSTPKIFIKVIRGLPSLEGLNFQSSCFLKALKYTESPDHLQILPGIKVWGWCYSITLRLSNTNVLLDVLIFMRSFICQE